MRGVNVLDGRITYEAVAEAHDLDVHAARGRPPALARLGGRLCGGSFSRRFVGVMRTIAYVTPAASEIVPTMKMTMPMSPRTFSKPNLE